MEATDILTIAGTVFGVVGTYYTWRSFRLSRIAADRIVDVQLWRNGKRSMTAQFTLRNGGTATALVDRIEVLRPRGVKVAWHFEPQAYSSAKSIKDKDVSNIHEVRLIVEPGKSGTTGMVLELPKPAEDVPVLKMRARISANDLARRYVWKEFTAKPSMATDQRAIDKSILGIPEDARP